jgi:hypothetical protein
MATDNVFLFVWNPCNTRVLGLKNSGVVLFCELVHLSDRSELLFFTYAVLLLLHHEIICTYLYGILMGLYW